LDVLAVGHAIVDRIGFVDDAVLGAGGLVKGSMRLVGSPAELVVKGVGAPKWQWAAGSAGNTAAALAMLGSKVAFVGRVGADDLGAAFAADMEALGVELHLGTGDVLVGPGAVDASGQCLVLVTPDGERTMLTYLGASTSLTPADLPAELVGRARVLYVEGYLWDSPGAVEAVEASLGACPVLALSLSDPFCVERHRGEFLELVSEHVGLLLANEAEALALTGSRDLLGAISVVRDWGCPAAITRGAAGSVVIGGAAGVTHVAAVPVDPVVDTTGAGDLYAAGLLHAFVAGASLEHCARLGSVAAAEVVGHVGARPLVSLRSLGAAAGLLPLPGTGFDGYGGTGDEAHTRSRREA
jgi:sugar/nucleoside kinase (ribokinase family)